MHLLELTLPTPAENLALDEALLESAERGDGPREVLRLWESPQPIVVVGRTSRVEQEVNLAACHAQEIPVLRRSSGGAAVMAGPGCFMYAVVLSYSLRPHLRMIDEAHRLVLTTLCDAIRPLVPTVKMRGTSDLTLDGRLKCSGNSLRCKRGHLLYHGTLLYDFPLDRIARLLRTPPRQPAYREGRPHEQFVANLPTGGETLRRVLPAAWGAVDPLADWPRAETSVLVAQKYGHDRWNLQR